MSILEELKSQANASNVIFIDTCNKYYDDVWCFYHAEDRGEIIPADVVEAMNQWHHDLHKYFNARDGENGFLGSRGL
jgi:hypothetical protein